MAVAIREPMPTAISPEVHVLTPRGDAAVSVIRLRQQLRNLEPHDRQWIVDLIQELVEDESVATA